MSDAEWAVTEPTLPGPAGKQGRGGRPAQRGRRDSVDTIRYLVKEGIRWRAMPADLPHWRTVDGVLDGWQESGATEAMHHERLPARDETIICRAMIITVSRRLAQPHVTRPREPDRLTREKAAIMVADSHT